MWTLIVWICLHGCGVQQLQGFSTEKLCLVALEDTQKQRGIGMTVNGSCVKGPDLLFE